MECYLVPACSQFGDFRPIHRCPAARTPRLIDNNVKRTAIAVLLERRRNNGIMAAITVIEGQRDHHRGARILRILRILSVTGGWLGYGYAKRYALFKSSVIFSLGYRECNLVIPSLQTRQLLSTVACRYRTERRLAHINNGTAFSCLPTSS